MDENLMTKKEMPKCSLIPFLWAQKISQANRRRLLFLCVLPEDVSA
jgi:hypothetical protein